MSLREVWPHEAADFTNWVRDNLDVLNEVLDLTLVNADTEAPAGTFSVDLVAEDLLGATVVIENQLERSDHDHLGKVITYLTAMDAAAAVWIVGDARPEHVRAVTWLNESTDASFHLLKVEAVQIGDSPPAPLITQIVGPSEESKVIGRRKRELAERHQIRHEFWVELLDRAKARTSLHANISPGYDTWATASSGARGLGLSYVVHQHAARVELYIDRGVGTEEETKAIFDRLLANREAVEAAFGSPIDWQQLEGKRACRVAVELPNGGYRDRDRWTEIQDRMIDAMIRFSDVLRPHIDALGL